MGVYMVYLLYETNFAWIEPGQYCKVGAICHQCLPTFLHLTFKALSGIFSIAFRVFSGFDFYLIAKPTIFYLRAVMFRHLLLLPRSRRKYGL